jgi:uncharacterized protein YrrD
MNNVELKEGTSVVSANGKELGKVNRFVLDPDTNKVTHIVVQKGWLFAEDKVIPFDKVQSMNEEDDKVLLNKNIEDFDDLPDFEERHFVKVSDTTDVPRNLAADYPVGPHPAPAFYWYPPVGYTGMPAYGFGYYSWPRTETQRNIPSDTVALKEGTNVVTSDDKHVGDVERLLVDPKTDKVTHFLISQGVFFKDKKQIPAGWIRSVTEDKVQLSVPASVLEHVPSYGT